MLPPLQQFRDINRKLFRQPFGGQNRKHGISSLQQIEDYNCHDSFVFLQKFVGQNRKYRIAFQQ